MAIDDVAIERLSDATKGMRQAFYFSLVFSLLTIYLLFDFRNPLSNEAEAVKSDVEVRLRTLIPILELHHRLRSDASILRGYFVFLEPYVAIDSAAEQAIIGVSSNDPKWLGLSPTDRDLARSTRDTIGWLENQIELYADGDLRDLHVQNIRDYLNWYVRPEIEFSSENAIRRLKASYRVARSLGQELPSEVSWPSTFYLHDFVKEYTKNKVNDAFDAARASRPEEVISAVVYLESFCSDNSIDYCSPYRIQAELDRGAFTIVSPADAEKIEISFFPGGIETHLIILVAPLLLFASVLLQTSQYYRRALLLSDISHDPGWSAQWDIPWLMTNIRVFEGRQGLLFPMFSLVVKVLFVAGLVMPAIAQIRVLVFSCTQFLSNSLHWGWPAVHFCASFVTATAVGCILNDELVAKGNTAFQKKQLRHEEDIRQTCNNDNE